MYSLHTHALDINDDLNEKICPGFLRIVAYVCMCPSAMVLPDQLKEFRKNKNNLSEIEYLVRIGLASSISLLSETSTKENHSFDLCR